jgi:hypothetical protein
MLLSLAVDALGSFPLQTRRRHRAVGEGKRSRHPEPKGRIEGHFIPMRYHYTTHWPLFIGEPTFLPIIVIVAGAPEKVFKSFKIKGTLLNCFDLASDAL